MAQAAALASNHADAIAELITDATVAALNAELAERNIPADRIVAVLPIAAQTLVSITPAKFRVLYRLAG